MDNGQEFSGKSDNCNFVTLLPPDALKGNVSDLL